MHGPPRLHWTRGRPNVVPQPGADGDARALEWIGRDDAGAPVARVVRVLGPLRTGWRLYRAVALDDEARIVQLRPTPPEGADWLAYVGGKVVGRAAVPLAAVRTAEAALAR